ncbi:hypothetical protein EJD97_000223 [Solanum chilense]|uniref:Uncharacterized protein n=1 Tax=Solanum chilense TaxID=4083 RepID=A0A6N2AQV0_SOLCI|nr:hypothetical protein EJD97_000223 [Solanum chilense]
MKLIMERHIQVNYTSGGMYASVAQPCESVNIDTNGGDKLFGKCILVQPTDSLMIEDQHRFKSHQDVNTYTGGGDKVFSQWAIVKPSDFSMKHNQHRFMNNQGVNTDTGGRDREQHYDQHQLMSHQGVKTKTNGGDRLFPKRSFVDKSYLSMTQGSAHKLLPQQNDLDSLVTQDQHHDQHQFMSYQGVNSDSYSGDDSFF